MNLYWFQRSSNFIFNDLSDELESAGFSGILFPCSSYGDDPFISIARNINSEKSIKYMVAIRPYTISPQYLSRISNSINKISHGRTLINFVSGWIYDHEKNIGGIHGKTTDASSSVERSNYLIEYINTVEQMGAEGPDFYVSVTNPIVFEKTKKHKVIIPYSWYKENKFDLSQVKAMISICPVIRKTNEELIGLKKDTDPQDVAFFTEEEFRDFFNEAKSVGIDGLLMFENTDNTEKNIIIGLISSLLKKEDPTSKDVR